VLAISLDQLRTWRDAGHDLHLAVNTTVADLIDQKFPHEVAEALAARGLPVDALILEVTETSILLMTGRVDVTGGRRSQRRGNRVDERRRVGARRAGHAGVGRC
jgi:hypothetical protein